MLQTKSQLAAEHTGLAFAGVAQGAQAPLQNRYPESQVVKQAEFKQLVDPLATVVQGVQREPQLLTEVSDRHWLPHR